MRQSAPLLGAPVTLVVVAAAAAGLAPVAIPTAVRLLHPAPATASPGGKIPTEAPLHLRVLDTLPRRAAVAGSALEPPVHTVAQAAAAGPALEPQVHTAAQAAAGVHRVATARVVPRFQSNPASRCPARSRSQRHGSSVRASPVKSHRRCAVRSPSRPARRCPGRSASRLPSKCRARSNASAGGRSAKWPEAVAEEDTEVVVMANKHSTRLNAAYTLDIHFDRSRPMQDKSIFL